MASPVDDVAVALDYDFGDLTRERRDGADEDGPRGGSPGANPPHGGCGIVGGGDEPSVSPAAAAAAPAAPRGTAAPAELVDATATLARVAPAQPERLT